MSTKNLADKIEELHHEWSTLQDEYDLIHPRIREDAVYARIKEISARQREIPREINGIVQEHCGEDDAPREPSEYPEHEKMRAISEKSQVVGEFIDWLREDGHDICKFEKHTRHSDELGDWTPEGWYPQRRRIEQLLADFFEIDLDKIEDEKRAMLEQMREEQAS